jgi:hypothetical protein
MQRKTSNAGRILVGSLIVLLGLVVGELRNPAPAAAFGCPYTQCFVGAGGAECKPDLAETRCVPGGGGF